MADVIATPAPPATPKIVPAAKPTSTSGAAPPSGRGVINVVPPPVEPVKPKPASATERMFDELRKRAKPTEGEATPTTPPAQPTPPEAPEGEPGEVEPGEASLETPATTEKPITPEQRKKESPWKLLDQMKQRAIRAEQEILETRKLVVDEATRKTEMEKLSTFEKRNKELEDHIRYVDYSKSQEFKEKHQAPYEKSWSRAMSELKELTIEDPSTGASRAVGPQDLLELVNLPLGKAREKANATFGDFADDVMAHRKEIRGLFDSQAQALEEARTQGSEREKESAQQSERQRTEVTKQIGEQWAKFNEEAAKDEKVGRYFSASEGDEDGNTSLNRGFDFVDKALSQNPMDPKLTPEQRSDIVKMHAAVRNRAAAFGRMRSRLEASQAKIAELQKELSQYAGTEPPTGGTSLITAPGGSPKASDSVFGALRKMAR